MIYLLEKLNLSELALLIFLIYFLVFFITVYFEIGWEEVFVLEFLFNLHSYSLVSPTYKSFFNNVVFEFGMWILVFQTLLDFWIVKNGYNLWNNKIFVGGFGNPSSFGISCNIFLVYLIFIRKKNSLSLFGILILSVGIIYSNSMLSYLLFLILSITSIIYYFSWIGLIILFPIGWIYVTLESYVEISHLSYKLSSLMKLFEGSTLSYEILSSSVSNRIFIYERFLHQLKVNHGQIFFWGFPIITT